jgi:hypothetical protein
VKDVKDVKDCRISASIELTARVTGITERPFTSFTLAGEAARSQPARPKTVLPAPKFLEHSLYRRVAMYVIPLFYNNLVSSLAHKFNRGQHLGNKGVFTAS